MESRARERSTTYVWVWAFMRDQGKRLAFPSHACDTNAVSQNLVFAAHSLPWQTIGGISTPSRSCWIIFGSKLCECMSFYNNQTIMLMYYCTNWLPRDFVSQREPKSFPFLHCWTDTAGTVRIPQGWSSATTGRSQMAFGLDLCLLWLSSAVW